jgi:hypothetical protein
VIEGHICDSPLYPNFVCKLRVDLYFFLFLKVTAYAQRSLVQKRG